MATHTAVASDTIAPQSGATDDPLVWIDCEMTGLNPDTEEIIEIFCILTTGNLQILDQEGYHAVVHSPASRLNQMDEWCTRTHANSGLTAAVLASTTTPEQAADGLYKYITKFIPEKRKALLAGNSVHADRAFLRKEPYARVIEHLHHRILDVSAIKEAGMRWCPREVMYRRPVKKGRHLARDDILESIEEARYYRNAIFRQA
ncbi:Phosphatidylinositol 3,4,5-trisphosphate-dependent Rac exchanger 2 protein [Conoideocrella luteorostrata]|uniref:Phosphatidylinositol 3,4,5-trisphosphate-dependent Rac exchanger 2 protein n=1 Tax=Conoideocrella luteorostrata TaxID=1105319 RepID=A0AAJ0CI48_9HYPO|nr:Phosphatidylinositol 3,4,5-trisphosphate-dependent Rac exchanger 2 protein [Conoideocrella luteorostrata]